MLNYENTVYFSETWGLVFLVLMFVTAVIYAVWPSNSDKFDKAAHAPLAEKDISLDEGDKS